MAEWATVKLPPTRAQPVTLDGKTTCAAILDS